MEYTKEKHKVHSMMYHIIFVVKYRKKVFTFPEIINTLKNKVDLISKTFDVKIISQETDIDHIHILIKAKPTLDIPKFINILKGHSSRELRKKHKEFLKNKLWGDAFWNPSYFIATTGNVSLTKLKEYIENQPK